MRGGRSVRLQDRGKHAHTELGKKILTKVSKGNKGRIHRRLVYRSPPITDSVASTAQPVRPASRRFALRLLLSFMILHVQFVRTGASNIVQLTMAFERRSPMQRYTLTGRERPTVALGDVQDRQSGVADRSLRAREDTWNKIEFLGLLAGLLTTLAFLSQAVKTRRTRGADDFSVPTLLMLVVGIGLWTVYGVMRVVPSIWLGNGIIMVLTASILSVKLRRAPPSSD